MKKEDSNSTGSRFTRKIESFTCDHCGASNEGNGYTNHCCFCLWSKHVDILPGDRECHCLGMMEPVSVLQKRGTHIILHRCHKCGLERPNKTIPADNFDAILEIAKMNAHRLSRKT